MFLECPNCHESVSFLRCIRTTAWGSFRCKACGSILAISFARRMMAAGTWLALLFVATAILGIRVHAWGWIVGYALLVVTLLATLYLFERVLLLERRAFTCRQCGYDLQGLPESRCPECGTPFDPGERAQIIARAAKPPPRPRHRWIAVIVVILVSLAVAAGMVVWRRASTLVAKPPAPATQSSQPAPPIGGT